MATVQQYLKYNDPIQILWREGSQLSPYVDIFQNLHIVNGRSVLYEIPDELNRVLISNYTEIKSNTYGQVNFPASNEFIVDYTMGIVSFNPSEEGKTLPSAFKGRGIIQYPAERIYVHSPNPYAVLTLQDFVELATQKLIEIDTAITNAETATTNAITATTAANVATVNAIHATADTIVAKDETIQAIAESNTATSAAITATEATVIAMDNAIIATNNAITATTNADTAALSANQAAAIANDATGNVNVAIDGATAATIGANSAATSATTAALAANNAHDSTLKIYQAPVQVFTNISQIYSNPSNGWTVMVKSTGDVYRYDGITLHDWVFIENWTGGSVPYASDTVGGLLSNNDYSKIHNKLIERSIVFILGTLNATGVQKPIIRFPLDGAISKVYGFCSVTGTTIATKIRVQKISETNFTGSGNWSDIFTTFMNLPSNSQISDNVILSLTSVMAGDYFRIIVDDYDTSLKGLTIQIEILV